MSKKGFTLVEIMIVVGIIAILAGIFLVGSSRFRMSANISRMKADLQKIEALQEVCMTKTGGYAGSNDALKLCVGGDLPVPPPNTGTYRTNGTQSCADLSGDFDTLWPSSERCLTR